MSEVTKRPEDDIMTQPDAQKKSIFGSTKKSKIINSIALIIFIGVAVWCALGKMGVL